MYERNGVVYGLEEIPPPVLLASGEGFENYKAALADSRLAEMRARLLPASDIYIQYKKGKWVAHVTRRCTTRLSLLTEKRRDSIVTPICTDGLYALVLEECTEPAVFGEIRVRAFTRYTPAGLTVGVDANGVIYAERRLSIVYGKCPHTGSNMAASWELHEGRRNMKVLRWGDRLPGQVSAGTDRTGQHVWSNPGEKDVCVAGRPTGYKANYYMTAQSPVLICVGDMYLAAVPVLRELGSITIPDGAIVLVLLALSRRTPFLPEWILSDLCVRICLPGHTRLLE